MPNHVTNKVEASEEVIEAILNKDGEPDFNTVLPMPKSLTMEGRGINCAAEDMAQLAWCEPLHENPLIAALEKQNKASMDPSKFDERTIEDACTMIMNKKKHGFYNCLDFSRAVWGTIWNAFSFDPDRSNESTLVFETAWSMPDPFYLALSKKFPEEEIKVSFADEDLGSNCGLVTYKNGEKIEFCNKENNADVNWEEFAFLMRYPGGNYQEYLAENEDDEVVYGC